MKTLFAMTSMLVAIAQPMAVQAQTTEASAKALGECLVEKSTGGDRVAMMRWMASAILSAPQLSDLASVSSAGRDKADQGAAAVWTRLLTIDCLSQAQAVAKQDAATGFRIAGEALGRVAMMELVTNPQTQQSMSGFTRYIDKNAMAKLMAK